MPWGDSDSFGNDNDSFGLGFGHESFGLGSSSGYSGPGTMGGFGDSVGLKGVTGGGWGDSSDTSDLTGDRAPPDYSGVSNPWGGYDFNASPTQDTLSLAAPPVNLSNLIGGPLSSFQGMPGVTDTDMGTPTSTYGFNTFGIGGWTPTDQTAANPGFLSGYSTNPTAADTSYSYGVNPASNFSNVLGNMSGLMGPQKSPSVQGWGDMSFGELDPTKNPALRYSQMPSTQEIANTMQSRYENSPWATAARYAKQFAPLASFAGPVVGTIANTAASAADLAARGYYGQMSNPGTQTGAQVGSTVGGLLGGPLGSFAGRQVGGYAGSQIAGEQGPTGSDIGRNAAGMIGNMAVNSMTQNAGPLGGLVGSLLGRGINAAMGGAPGSENTGYANSIGNGLGQLAQTGLNYYMSNRAASQAENAQRQAAGQQRQLAQEMMSRVDPFGTQRAQYGTQLQQLTQNPEQALMSNPILAAGYRQALQQGNRAMAASGNLGSGARVAALAQLAPAYLGKIYDQEAGRLASLAGANISSPSAIQNALMAQGRAADMEQQATMQRRQNQQALLRSLLGGQYFNQPRTGYGTYGENYYG